MKIDDDDGDGDGDGGGDDTVVIIIIIIRFIIIIVSEIERVVVEYCRVARFSSSGNGSSRHPTPSPPVDWRGARTGFSCLPALSVPRRGIIGF